MPPPIHCPALSRPGTQNVFVTLLFFFCSLGMATSEASHLRNNLKKQQPIHRAYDMTVRSPSASLSLNINSPHDMHTCPCAILPPMCDFAWNMPSRAPLSPKLALHDAHASLPPLPFSLSFLPDSPPHPRCSLADTGGVSQRRRIATGPYGRAQHGQASTPPGRGRGQATSEEQRAEAPGE